MGELKNFIINFLHNMRKIYSLFFAAVCALGVNAQSWDFRNWSTETRDLLISTSNTQFALNASTAGRWELIAAAANEELVLGSAPLIETAGLLFTGGSGNKIRVDLGTEAINSARVGLNGVNIAITIPNLKAGDKLNVEFITANIGDNRQWNPTNVTFVSSTAPGNIATSGPNSSEDGGLTVPLQTNTYTVTADGEVKLVTSGGLNVFRIYTGETTSIDTPASSNVIAIEYYNLSGVRIQNPTHGVVICKKTMEDGSTTIYKQIIR